jgi:hypothetical protein
MSIDDHPRALAVDVFNQIITDIKESRPTRSDGTSTTGFVYAQLCPGEMVSPRDYARPWSPMGGSGTPSAGAPPLPGSTAPAEPAGAAAKRAMEAAFKTADKFDKLLMVTDDATTQSYSGGGRHLNFQYAGILQAMEAAPVPERSAEEKERLARAEAVLYQPDRQPTPVYQQYLTNQKAYTDAKKVYVLKQIETLANPALADSWPLLADTYLTDVNQAYDRWKSQGAEAVEAAIATQQSLGVPLEQGMIANARKLLENWTVSVGGTQAKTPYTYISPSEWSEIATDDIGWTTLKRETNTYQSHFSQHGYQLGTGNWSGSSSSSGGSAGLSVFGFGFAGSYSEQDSQSNSAYSNTSTDGTHMTNDASSLSLELQYGLCEIARPWLVTDLFHMKHWYLRGEKKGAISDGTITGQVMDKDRTLPMIPTHFLVVRNVRITTSQWGSVRDTLQTYWNSHTDSASSGGSSVSGNVSIPVWGPLSVTGGYSHSDSHYQGDFKDEGGSDVRDDAGSYFENDTLVINGAQIVAYLGEVVPLAPPQDDPALANE